MVEHKHDILGASASILCMIHCLITPFLFAAQATAGATCAEIGPIWWKVIDILFLAITYFAVYFTARSTSIDWLPKAIYSTWIILAILIANNFLHIMSLPHALVYIPAIALSGFHFYNMRYSNCCDTAVAAV